jgi:O-succinylbenzoate synthase
MVVMSTWTLFSFEIPLVIGGIREGLVIQLDERWGEIAPLPGRSKETRNQALNQLLQIFCEGKVKGELFPSVQFGLECTLLPMRAVTAPLYAFLQGSPEEILTRAENAYARGYHVAKIKISSLSVEDAVELIHALTDRFRLRVDCNRAFSFDQAVALFSRVDPRQLDYVEDPTYETERLADFPFPFALDEIVFPLKVYRNLYGFILKPTVLGGKKGCAPFVHFAKKHNLDIVFSPAFESGLGLLQILRVAEHFDLLSHPVGLDTHRYLAHDILHPGIEFNTPIIKTTQFHVNTEHLKEIAHGTCALPDLAAC